MSSNLFVGGFPYDSTEADLGKVFAACGKVVRVKILTERDTRRSRGLAFILMETEAEAQRAIKELDGTEVGHRRIFVTEARPAEKAGGGYTGPERRSGRDRRKSAPASGPDKKPWSKKPSFGQKPWEKKHWSKEAKPGAGEGRKPWEKKPRRVDEGKERWGAGEPHGGRKPGDFMSKPRGFKKKPGGGSRGR